MIVADASAVVLAVADSEMRNLAAVERFVDGALAPHVIDAEVGQALRKLVLRRRLRSAQAERSLHGAHRLISRRIEHASLLDRAWELRDNVSFYDALYVAVAESQDLTLLTADARLARASGLRCRVELV